MLDEVFAVGDAGFKRRCEARYRALRAAGHTVILVSHDPNVVGTSLYARHSSRRWSSCPHRHGHRRCASVPFARERRRGKIRHDVRSAPWRPRAITRLVRQCVDHRNGRSRSELTAGRRPAVTYGVNLPDPNSVPLFVNHPATTARWPTLRLRNERFRSEDRTQLVDKCRLRRGADIDAGQAERSVVRLYHHGAPSSRPR